MTCIYFLIKFNTYTTLAFVIFLHWCIWLTCFFFYSLALINYYFLIAYGIRFIFSNLFEKKETCILETLLAIERCKQLQISKFSWLELILFCRPRKWQVFVIIKINVTLNWHQLEILGEWESRDYWRMHRSLRCNIFSGTWKRFVSLLFNSFISGLTPLLYHLVSE